MSTVLEVIDTSGLVPKADYTGVFGAETGGAQLNCGRWIALKLETTNAALIWSNGVGDPLILWQNVGD